MKLCYIIHDVIAIMHDVIALYICKPIFNGGKQGWK